MQTKLTTTDFQIIMHSAWTLAREAAGRFGGEPRQYISDAMRESWHDYKLAIYRPTRKEIALALDSAASRAETFRLKSATRKQRWFLAGLLHDCGLTADDVGCGLTNMQAMLTVGKASTWIDTMLAETKQAA